MVFGENFGPWPMAEIRQGSGPNSKFANCQCRDGLGILSANLALFIGMQMLQSFQLQVASPLTSEQGLCSRIPLDSAPGPRWGLRFAL